MELPMIEVSVTKSDKSVELWSGMTVDQGILIAARALLDVTNSKVRIYDM
jgi:hypothetical protein